MNTEHPDGSSLARTQAAAPVAGAEDQILVTGAGGFIGSWVVRSLVERGFLRIRCLTRSGSDRFDELRARTANLRIETVRGNLLSRDACARAAEGAAVVYHLAAGVEKTFPGCFLNSAVATRNLLDAVLETGALKRFVNTSSLAVYDNSTLRRGAPVDESCPLDSRLVERFDPYAWGKARQDELVREYGRARGLAYVIARPGVTFGPGKPKIPGRVGIDTFGIFLHLGMGHAMPFTYVENCAEAIVLAGLVPGIEGEEINIVDDALPTSRAFLRGYKRSVRRFLTLPVPYPAFYLFNALWEKYSSWSGGQLPPAFNRRTCAAYYRRQSYPNRKAKAMLGWQPRVPMREALDRYFAYARNRAATHS